MKFEKFRCEANPRAVTVVSIVERALPRVSGGDDSSAKPGRHTMRETSRHLRCSEAHMPLSLSLDGELLQRELDALTAHTETCFACAAYRDKLQQIRRELRFEVMPLMPNVAAQVIAAIQEALPHRRPRRSISPTRRVTRRGDR